MQYICLALNEIEDEGCEAAVEAVKRGPKCLYAFLLDGNDIDEQVCICICICLYLYLLFVFILYLGSKRVCQGGNSQHQHRRSVCRWNV